MTAIQRVIFVNRFYWPEEPATAQLLTDLAESLAACDHRVTVVTSLPTKHSVPKTENRNGVEIIRVSGPRFGRNNVFLKALSFLTFARGALRAISNLLKSGDVLVVMTDPPLLNLPASALAQKRGARLVHWVQDIYPEIAMAAGSMSFAQTFRRRRDRAWRTADICVVPGADMATFVHTRGIDPSTILISPNWAPFGLDTMPPTAVETLRKDWGLVGKFIVMYSGNLGRVHDLEPILEIADALRNETDIIFLFVGDGAQKARLQAIASSRGLKNVVFKSAQPRHRLGPTLTLANLHLVTMREGCEQLVFPSKLYGIAAVGRPVIFIGPRNCELARIIEGQGLGRSFSRTDVNTAVLTIRHLRHAPADCARMGKAIQMFSDQTGGLPAATSTWDRLLRGLKSLAPQSQFPQK